MKNKIFLYSFCILFIFAPLNGLQAEENIHWKITNNKYRFKASKRLIGKFDKESGSTLNMTCQVAPADDKGEHVFRCSNSDTRVFFGNTQLPQTGPARLNEVAPIKYKTNSRGEIVETLNVDEYRQANIKAIDQMLNEKNSSSGFTPKHLNGMKQLFQTMDDETIISFQYEYASLLHDIFSYSVKIGETVSYSEMGTLQGIEQEIPMMVQITATTDKNQPDRLKIVINNSFDEKKYLEMMTQYYQDIAAKTGNKPPKIDTSQIKQLQITDKTVYVVDKKTHAPLFIEQTWIANAQGKQRQEIISIEAITDK